MQQLYGTYPTVRILKAQLYRTHDSSHDSQDRYHQDERHITSHHHLLDFFTANRQSLPAISCELLQYTIRPIKKFTFRSYGTVIISLRI